MGKTSLNRLYAVSVLFVCLASSPNQVPDTNWKPVAAGDMDRDGTADILWQHATDGRIAFWRMIDTTMLRGDPTSPSQVSDTNWKIRALADFNQDGDADFVWQNQATGQIAVWLMRFQRGSMSFLSGDPLGPGLVRDLSWKIVGTGDFNRDGSTDIVWQHQGDGRIAVWEMQGTTLVRGDLISPGQVFDLDWKIRGVGDINGDDWPDLDLASSRHRPGRNVADERHNHGLGRGHRPSRGYRLAARWAALIEARTHST